MRVLDSHLHLWDPSRLDYDWLEGPLARAYGAAELATAERGDAAAGEQSAGSIFVQAECVEAQFLDEVRWVAAHAAETGVRGIVAGARLDRGEETLDHLDALGGFPEVVGVRHLLQDAPAGTALSEEFLRGARALAGRGLRFDVCVRARQLPEIVALADAVPALPLVIDHLGKPVIGSSHEPRRPDPAWRRALHELAGHRQVVVKLSGLPAESDGAWTDEQVAPFLDAAAEEFGEDRLLWGSDWPVSAIAAGRYRTGGRAAWLSTVATWAEHRGVDADAVLWRNAARFYGLD
ncbi:amidohydrolase [uncultured Microbacterium sp.]|uniref:amidohydrolase family protein n=1 Tax=uncultured Microbacterium sp. TaxID=191216 RepID=UPI0025FA6F1F|nr:amidohydrolase family protein [uncultured Microbacterium sp.]